MSCPVQVQAYNEDDPDGSPLRLLAKNTETDRGLLRVADLGEAADAIVDAGAVGTMAAKLRRLTSDLDAVKTAVDGSSNSPATSCPTGTKTCSNTKARLKAATLANTISLTVIVRSLGDADYVGVGDTDTQEARLTSVGDSIDLDVDPYAVYVIDNHTATAAVVEYIARVTA